MPRTFTSMIWSHCSIESSVTSCSKNTPAALTSSQGAPSSAVTTSRSSATACSLRRSQPKPAAPSIPEAARSRVGCRAVAAGDAEPVAREAGGDGRADAARGAGDERDPLLCHSCSRMLRVSAISVTQVL